jgi:serine/threonine-protein kinase
MDLFMQKAMAKSPADRYGTPREFISAIEQLQQRIQPVQPDRRDLAQHNYVAQFEYEPRQEQNMRGVQAAGSQEPERQKVNADEEPVTPPVNTQKHARFYVLASNQYIELTGELMVVGRQDPVLGIFPEITLTDKTVGRRHAYVRNQHGQYTVEDLNALNKTRLNGVILTPHEERTLKDGDILRFGSVEVRFELR